jgi:hypothetical protein
MFCVPEHVFDGTEGVGSHFQVLRYWTRFGRYRRHQVQFSCFGLVDSFSTVTRASVVVLMFCAPELVLDGTEALCLVFMFCALGPVLRGTEGVGSRFHVYCSQTHFRRYRGCRVSFSCFTHRDSFFQRYRRPRVFFLCFALPDSFWAVPSASSLVFMFQVSRYWTHFPLY